MKPKIYKFKEDSLHDAGGCVIYVKISDNVYMPFERFELCRIWGHSVDQYPLWHDEIPDFDMEECDVLGWAHYTDGMKNEHIHPVLIDARRWGGRLVIETWKHKLSDVDANPLIIYGQTYVERLEEGKGVQL